MRSDPLLDVAGGDVGYAEALRELLTVLARGRAGPLVQELARDVLADRTDLREAMMFPAYSDEMEPRLARFWAWHDDLTAEDRRDVVALAERYLDRLRATARR